MSINEKGESPREKYAPSRIKEEQAEIKRKENLAQLTSEEYFNDLGILEDEYKRLEATLRRIAWAKAQVSRLDRDLRETITTAAKTGEDANKYIAWAQEITAKEESISREDMDAAAQFYQKIHAFCLQYGLGERPWAAMFPESIFRAIETEWFARRFKLSTKSE